MNIEGRLLAQYHKGNVIMATKLPSLIDKYNEIGLKKGSSLLFSPQDALRFANDLEVIGVGIVGLELWYYLEKEGQSHIVENPYGPEFGMELAPANSVQKSIEAAKNYIAHQLPEDTALVSFVLDTDEAY